MRHEQVHDPVDLFCGPEEPGMTGMAANRKGVFIMDLALKDTFPPGAVFGRGILYFFISVKGFCSTQKCPLQRERRIETALKKLMHLQVRCRFNCPLQNYETQITV